MGNGDLHFIQTILCFKEEFKWIVSRDLERNFMS
jgi:hypothetical protein